MSGPERIGRCELWQGDCREVLRGLPEESIHSIVTSPPYFGLRDYGIPPSDWPEVSFAPLPGLPPVIVPAMRCCLGLEPDPWAFVGHLVAVFREARRVLRADGCLMLNIGDSFAGTGATGGGADGSRRGVEGFGAPSPNGKGTWKSPRGWTIKPKDLLGIPWRLAFALQADGWWLRNDLVWHKPAPMPESVRDRCTRAHEAVFHFAKSGSPLFWQARDTGEGSRKPDLSEKIPDPNDPTKLIGRWRGSDYFWDAEAIAEEPTGGAHNRGKGAHPKSARAGFGVKQNGSFSTAVTETVTSRNARSVWTINTEPTSAELDFANADYVDAHGMPRKLSPNCPVHGQDARLRQGTPSAASDGELLKAHRSHTRRSGTHLDAEQTPAVEPKEHRKTLIRADIPPDETKTNTLDCKTPSLSTASHETAGRNQCTLFESALSTQDSDFPPSEAIATDLDTETSRTDPARGLPQHDSASEGSASDTLRIQPRLFETPPYERTPESRSAERQPFSPEGQNGSDDKAHRRSGNGTRSACTDGKCNCRLSQSAHFAVMPSDLARRCVLATTSEAGCCPECGAPWVRRVETSRSFESGSGRSGRLPSGKNGQGLQGGGVTLDIRRGPTITRNTTGWDPFCTCAPVERVPCTVLDPFAGAGTTLLAAERLGRRSIGIEASAEYVALALRRIAGDRCRRGEGDMGDAARLLPTPLEALLAEAAP